MAQQPQYLIRFDDICPTMNWTAWNAVEAVLRSLKVRPIVAIVPDNRDEKLVVGEAAADFWDRVREWQRMSWTIALHGFQHRYSTREAGILGINARSEFAGVPKETQAAHIDAALEIFRSQGVQPTAWVAPGHSFDWATVDCLRQRGIVVISDGFFRRPVLDRGCVWIPQQLWRFRRMPAGLWTVCCHINAWTSQQVARFERDVAAYRPMLVGVDDVMRGDIGAAGLWDRIFSLGYRQMVLARRALAPGE